jgi:hypothetical protein
MRGKNLIELLEQRQLLSVTLLHDIASGSSGSYSYNFTQAGSVVVFPALTTGNYGQLWQSDGTPANTSQISSFSTGIEFSMAMASLNGTAYFFASRSSRHAGCVPHKSVRACDEFVQRFENRRRSFATRTVA